MPYRLRLTTSFDQAHLAQNELQSKTFQPLSTTTIKPFGNMEAFHYKPLEHPSAQIRLLEVLPLAADGIV